ncbi:MAG: PqqD family protein, partial [Lachnospiraceae bacterium]|nr:PqqD family protein [Lachnospiraceae bacterium]
MLERYQLRYAAGQYWLLDMEQPGVPYKQPMCMNAVGAEIWEMLKKGWSVEQMTEVFMKEYQVEKEEIQEDIIQFQKQLTAFGVVIEE